MFTRIPGREGMSSKSRLALEVKDFDVKGSIGEDRWETPVDVEFDKRIYDWTEGLRSDGGGGNVLKSRKQEREMGGQDLKVAGSERHSDSEQRRHTTRAPIRRTEVHPAAAKAPDQSVQKEDGSRSWKTTWRPVTRRPYNFLLPMKLIEGFGDVPFAGDSDIEDAEVKPTQGADVPDSRTSQPSQTPAKSRRFPNALDFSTQGTAEAPHTPSNWSESGYGDEDVSLASPERAEESDRIGTPMDSPMQVDANVTLDDPDAKEPSTQDVEILSFPPPPSLPLPEPPVTVLVPNSSLPQPNISPSCLPRGQKSFARKTVMQSARGRSIHPDTSAGRILVPNSDTSASYSQPSQSQSQSQSLQAALDQSRPEQRFAQSLSYSPKSQSQFELPAQQGDSQESQKSGPASHLRNEVLPSLNLPARTVDASAEEVPNEALPSNSSHAPQSPKVSEQTIKPEHIASSRLELASPRTWGSPMRMAGSQAANQATEDREEQPLSPLHENGTQTVNGGVESFSTHSEEADDEAEPDPFPSDDTVSFDDQGAESSDDGEQLSSDDDRMDLALILAPRRASLSRVPSWRPAERSASPDLVPDSQPAPPAPAVPDRPSSQQESNLRDSSEAPALPSSPDVFLDEASFHGDVLSRSGSPSRRRPEFQIRRSSAVVDKEDAVPDVVLDEAQAQDRVVPGTSNHDVEMWIEPTFARRRKRPLVPSTSAEEQPRKKRKIPSSAAVYEARKAVNYVKSSRPSRKREFYHVDDYEDQADQFTPNGVDVVDNISHTRFQLA
ncbi:hypothetical protein EUX98_g8283 [Antrodiella citrinella]|uniref:Uncharacterized protein n=1 Tax=Antrodiella citrinella TaxID=2447956 RepID=A0A4S4M9E0_9APHY|nr:hypothetical protein EUX98_g8283 [Antrodiella citrinella]